MRTGSPIQIACLPCSPEGMMRLILPNVAFPALSAQSLICGIQICVIRRVTEGLNAFA